jgi:hypothetical protein
MRESCRFNRTLLVSIYLPAQKMRRAEGDLCSKARGTDNKAQLLLWKHLIIIRTPPLLHCTAIARLPAITNFCHPHYLPARSLGPRPNLFRNLNPSSCFTVFFLLPFSSGCYRHRCPLTAPVTRQQWFIYLFIFVANFRHFVKKYFGKMTYSVTKLFLTRQENNNFLIS